MTAPVLSLKGKKQITVSSLEEFKEPGFKAWDSHEGNLTKQVVITETPLEKGFGKLIRYTISDASGNQSTQVRRVQVLDKEQPLLQLQGKTSYILPPGKPFEEPGYTVWDSLEGDLTQQVKVEILPGATSHENTYLYTVKDSFGNTASAQRLVIHKDMIPPVISLQGSASLTLEFGQAYQEAGALATDNLEGDISSRIQTEGYVNVNQAGSYTIQYSVTDSYGNSASASRQITVKAKPRPPAPAPQQTQASTKTQTKTQTSAAGSSAPAQPKVSGKRIVYLTFDDGPYQYTEQLLNILAKYNVKATFFVTAAFSQYSHLIGREAREGHTVAMHTATHTAAIMYKDDESFFKDMAAIEKLIVKQTGQQPWLLRFPFGSSNILTRNLNVGIMTRLTKEVVARGYRYTDWNVESGDGAGTLNSEQVFQNVVNGIAKTPISVVLMHDVQPATIQAIESIIQWCLNNGCTLLPITPDTADIHHEVYN